MPFFSRRDEVEEPAPEPVYEQEAATKKRGGLLGSLRRDPSPTPTANTANTANTHQSNSSRLSNSTFHTTNSSRTSTSGASTATNTTTTPKRGSSLLHKFGGGGHHNDNELDPSIVQARERVMAAEAAERDADRALELARRGVQAAREDVRRLEVEAKEEARRAKIKAYHAKEVSKRGKALGRTLSSFFFWLIFSLLQGSFLCLGLTANLCCSFLF